MMRSFTAAVNAPKHAHRLGSPPTMSEVCSSDPRRSWPRCSYGSDQLVRAGRGGARADRGAPADAQRLRPRRCRGRLVAAAEASSADDPRPFAGVPIAVKDTAPVAGHAVHDGLGRLRRLRARATTPSWSRRLRDAGFVIVGKTNMPEFGILPVTESRRFGPARNPWDTDRTPGGSSGGAAAAVASGMVPLAHGSDGGGSIRIPASCCGLVGLKPTRGRISRGPDHGDDFLVQDGVLTRTVAETAAMLDVLAGYEVGDATWAPPPSEPFAAAVEARAGPAADRLHHDRADRGAARPGVRARHPRCRAAAGATRPRRRGDRCTLGGRRPAPTSSRWSSAPRSPWACSSAAMVTGREPTEELVEPLSWTIWNGDPRAHRARLSARAHAAQRGDLARDRRALGELRRGAHARALAERPVRIGEIDACSDDPWDDFRRSGRFTPYTAIFNVTGQPAISVPLFHGDDGLPTSIQLAGRPADEARCSPGRAARGGAALGRPPARAGRGLAALGPERTVRLELLLVLAASRSGRAAAASRLLPVHVLPQDRSTWRCGTRSGVSSGRRCETPELGAACVFLAVRLTFG